jgi:hypothetical protein
MGVEWIKDMNSSDIINQMKDLVFPNRIRGGRSVTVEQIKVLRQSENYTWYEHTINQPLCKIISGTNMSNYRPTIDGIEYTWADLKRQPKELLQVKLYRYLIENKILGEEE